MTFVWITFARGVMAITPGLALALHRDRAPAALVNFMGIYWIANGLVTFKFGAAAQGRRRFLAHAAGAIGIATGAVVLVAIGARTAIASVQECPLSELPGRA